VYTSPHAAWLCYGVTLGGGAGLLILVRAVCNRTAFANKRPSSPLSNPTNRNHP